VSFSKQATQLRAVGVSARNVETGLARIANVLPHRVNKSRAAIGQLENPVRITVKPAIGEIVKEPSRGR
jgi:hypothetical protein